MSHRGPCLEEPLRQLANNAGLEGSVVVNEVKTRAKGIGLNIATGEYEDMVKAGIIDPAMVTRSALQNAASIAKNILTTEVIVADKPEKEGAGRRHAGRYGRHGRHDVTETTTGRRRKAPPFGAVVAGTPAGAQGPRRPRLVS